MARDEFTTKVVFAPDMHVVKTTWWSGRQWYTTHEVRPGSRMTPTFLAKLHGHSPKEVRDWLRANYPRPESEKGSNWVITEEMAIAYGKFKRR